MYDLGKWLRISLFNLCIVAIIGVIMRYKIGFEFPYFDQKHLQHAHSHFAFYGWIAHTLYSFMVSFLYNLNALVQSLYFIRKIVLTIKLANLFILFFSNG